MSGIELIAAERLRQIEQEGWTAAHDDEHHFGMLAVAGACYALNASVSTAAVPSVGDRLSKHAEELWPWGGHWWKPKDPIRDLTRAGALIAAEIDRLQRIVTP